MKNPYKIAAAMAFLAATMTASEPGGMHDFFELLRDHAGLTQHDMNVALPAGKAVAINLSHHEKDEIAVAGAGRIRVPLHFFVDSFRQMPSMQRGQQLITRPFSDPPQLKDLDTMTLPAEDLRAFAGCRPGMCDVKLSAAMMAQLGAGARATAGAGLTEIFRKLIFEYVTRYLANGNRAMMIYADKPEPVESSAAFLRLVKESDWLRQEARPLYDCLQSFSGRPCPEVDSFFFWSIASFGFKPVFSVTHVMTHRTARQGRPWMFIAFKQIYADHYLDASLGLAVLGAESGDAATWVFYVNRTRIDALGGWLGPLKRSVMEDKSRVQMRQNLSGLKNSLEMKFATGARYHSGG